MRKTYTDPIYSSELEQLMIQSGYLEGAPFRWVGVMLRYGLKNDSKPEYDKIDNEDGELPLTIEIDTNEMVGANKQQLKRLFTIATLRALIDAGRKYGLATKLLEERQRFSELKGLGPFLTKK